MRGVGAHGGEYQASEQCRLERLQTKRFEQWQNAASPGPRPNHLIVDARDQDHGQGRRV